MVISRAPIICIKGNRQKQQFSFVDQFIKKQKRLSQTFLRK